MPLAEIRLLAAFYLRFGRHRSPWGTPGPEITVEARLFGCKTKGSKPARVVGV